MQIVRYLHNGDYQPGCSLYVCLDLFLLVFLPRHNLAVITTSSCRRIPSSLTNGSLFIWQVGNARRFFQFGVITGYNGGCRVRIIAFFQTRSRSLLYVTLQPHYWTCRDGVRNRRAWDCSFRKATLRNDRTSRKRISIAQIWTKWSSRSSVDKRILLVQHYKYHNHLILYLFQNKATKLRPTHYTPCIQRYCAGAWRHILLK